MNPKEKKDYTLKQVIVPTLVIFIFLLFQMVDWHKVDYSNVFLYDIFLIIYGVYQYIIYKDYDKNHDQVIMMKEAKGGL